MTVKQYSFEEGIRKLEELSNSFQAENLNLEENLENFQLACQIYDSCVEQLEKAKNTIRIFDPDKNTLKEFEEEK